MGRRRARAMVLGAIGVAVGVVACRQIVGIEDEPVGRGGVDAGANVDVGVDDADVGSAFAACGISFATATCQTCVTQSCCDEAMACSADPTCKAAESCLAACAGDATCRAQCTTDQPAGTSASVPALDACLAKQCRTACGLACGGLTLAVNADATLCASCLAIETCARQEECAADVGCQAILRCQEACLTQDCVAACSTADDAGAALLFPFEITSNICGDACEFGSYWACVGHVTVPSAAAQIALTVQVVDFMLGTPISGLDVRLCGPVHGQCEDMIDYGVTSPDGTVTLQVQNDGGLSPQLNGYLDISSPATPPAIVPELHYWSVPLSQAHAALLYPISAMTPGSWTTFFANAGWTPEATQGHLILTAYDCGFGSSPGVSFTFNGEFAPDRFYIVGGVPEKSATTTDDFGMGGFINLQPDVGSTFHVAATPTAIAQPSSEADVFVLPGTITFVDMVPTP